MTRHRPVQPPMPVGLVYEDGELADMTADINADGVTKVIEIDPALYDSYDQLLRAAGGILEQVEIGAAKAVDQ